MSSGSRVLALLLLVLAGMPGAAAEALRVCADPNNLPFSNEKGEGFENAIAELIAADLGREVKYTWWPQRRGFIRHTLRAKYCDVVMGLPVGYELAQTTKPYYRSSYVFVTRKGGPKISSMDDPQLRALRIGVHVVGDDGANVPPAQALAKRGIVHNVRGYSIYGDYSQPDPPRGLIDALARGEIDVALAWGPLAGYFATREPVPLELTPVPPVPGLAHPMHFAIALGVRRGDDALKSELETVLERRRDEIRKVLERYGVPLIQGSP